MKKEHFIILFNQKQVRRHWDEEKELWFFSVIDIIEVLTESALPKRYWSDLKIKLQKEGSEVYDKIVQLKLQDVWDRLNKDSQMVTKCNQLNLNY